jgi:hypothetical protein
MKIKTYATIILMSLFFMGAATAADEKKASVSVQQGDGVTQIIITPAKGYKWNVLYPSKLKFSVCNETECIFFTENISIEEKK